eukprot:1666535-Lingulodinium_polyedra.AAC.1
MRGPWRPHVRPLGGPPCCAGGRGSGRSADQAPAAKAGRGLRRSHPNAVLLQAGDVHLAREKAAVR